MQNNLHNLEKKIIEILENAKAEDILHLDVQHLTDITHKVIICTGTSSRHTKAIAEHVVENVKKMGLQPLGVEGFESGEWILIDLGSVVLHIMQCKSRDYYQLESLWQKSQRMPDKLINHQ
jgi:ribosome-associated protein